MSVTLWALFVLALVAAVGIAAARLTRAGRDRQRVEEQRDALDAVKDRNEVDAEAERDNGTAQRLRRFWSRRG